MKIWNFHKMNRSGNYYTQWGNKYSERWMLHMYLKILTFTMTYGYILGCIGTNQDTRKATLDVEKRFWGSQGWVIHTCNQEVQKRLPGLEEWRGGKTDRRRQGSTKTKYYENTKMKLTILYVN